MMSLNAVHVDSLQAANDHEKPEQDNESRTHSGSSQIPETADDSLRTQESYCNLSGKNESPTGDTEDLEGPGSVQSRPLYSIFSRRQKYFITSMVIFAAFFSPLSASIYLPILNTLAANLHVSNSLINLTITSYMIFQGLAPMMFGTFSESTGRRPAYMIAFTIYLVANIGLALHRSYVALFLLRCLQSTGSSGTIAIGIGVVSDIATSSERGSYMGVVFGCTMLGPAVGPVIGGLLSQFLQWRSIFWFLVIGSGTFLAIYAVFIDETSRRVVGNGSKPPQPWNVPFIKWGRVHKRAKRKISGISESKGSKPAEQVIQGKRSLPNPLKAISVLIEKDVGIVVVYHSILIVLFYDVLASLPALFKEIYSFNDFQIGLCYLPFGIGCAVASIVSGRILDWNYKRTARKHGFVVDIRRGDDLKDFPIEKARLGIIWPTLYTGFASIIAYGWTLEANSSLAGPLVLLFLIGMCLMASINSLGTMLVDLYPMAAATVTAGSNVVRCSLGAGATAVIDPMISNMGRGWCFTFIALLGAATSPVLLVELRYGMKWREARRVRIAAEATRKTEDGG